MLVSVGRKFCAALALSILNIGFASAQDEAAPEKPLGERLMEVAATADHLWVRTIDGVVAEFDRHSGERKILVKEGALDIDYDRGRLIGFIRSESDEPEYHVFDFNDQSNVGKPLTLASDFVAFINDDDVRVISEKALFTLDAGIWRRVELSTPLRSPRNQVNVTTNREGIIYVAYNLGEWGGGMQAVDPATGKVSEIRRIDGEVCDGPLGQECDPVTDVIPDVLQPECVIASVGLSHFFTKGRILRICGGTVEVIFSELMPLESEQNDFAEHYFWPFFDMAVTSDGWIAASYGRLFRSSNGSITQSETPELEEWNGLNLAVVDDDIIVFTTDLNWAVSLSGYTPLLVQIEN